MSTLKAKVKQRHEVESDRGGFYVYKGLLDEVTLEQVMNAERSSRPCWESRVEHSWQRE
jgi:hypothetical protein